MAGWRIRMQPLQTDMSDVRTSEGAVARLGGEAQLFNHRRLVIEIHNERFALGDFPASRECR